MQRGIDSYFSKNNTPVAGKRKAPVISSDEEISESPQSKMKNVSKQKIKKSRVEESKLKAENVSKITNKPNLSKLISTKSPKDLKRVNPLEIFGGETPRIEAKKRLNPKIKEEHELSDDDVNQSLMEVDLEASKHTELNTPKKKKENGCRSSRTPQKSKLLKTCELKSPKIEPANSSKSKIENKSPEKSQNLRALTDAKSLSKKNKNPEEITAKSKADTDFNSSILSDEERYERKCMSAILYQKYKNRQSVINPGSKEVPKGKPNCLAGLTFLITGVLESLERDEANAIVKELGGKISSTVGKKLNYLVVGEEAGPKKLAVAEELDITILSEDGLLNLIREKSGLEKSKDKINSNEINPKTPVTFHAQNEIATKKEVKNNKESYITPTKIKTEKKVSPIKKNLPKQKDIKVKEFKPQTKIEVNEDMLAWVEKYKPTSVKDIIGQQGAASNVVKLTNWLSKWYVNHDGKKKLQKPNPWAKNDDGSFYKAALLSGPPGIGKTTTAALVCKELGFDVVEFNASDTRSKRLLKEEVSELLSNKSLYGYFNGNDQAVTKKHVLIMDEVDGMAGNEDRGGIQELIGLIKDSSVPIICMCNDRNHQKMRSLVNYCYDLRFNKPKLEQIKGRILSICFKEKLKIAPSKIEEMIAATNNDIRQSINHLTLLSAGNELNLKPDSEKKDHKFAQKDLKMGPWEVVRKVFSLEEHKNMSLGDKSDLFFHDYSLAPLFVQQNYLQVSPSGPKSEVLNKVALTANALSLGDLVDKRIRSNSAWSLLPTQAVFSSVMPGEYMEGHFTGQINFPGWLGKNSRTTKRSRLAQEIHDHTRMRTSGSRLSIRMDYAPFLLANIVRPLKEKGLDGVNDSLNALKEYRLLREDIESLIELTTWPGKKGIMDSVDGRVKAALTRAYNKNILAYSYSSLAGIKKKRSDVAEDESDLLTTMESEEGGNVLESDEEIDDLEHDNLIKEKKKPTTKAATSKAFTSNKVTGKTKAAAAIPKAKK